MRRFRISKAAALTLTGWALLLLPGCNRMMVGLAGLHPYEKNVTQAKRDRLARRMGFPRNEHVIISQQYARRIDERRGKEPEKHTRAKYQPLQLRWYSAGGRVQWIIPNCDVGGFPNLQWKRFGLPDTLIAPLRAREYADSAWTVADDFRFMVERHSGRRPTKEPNAKGHLVVYWTYFMGRQSVRLARHVERWRKNHGSGIQVLYVNADSLLMGMDKPEAGPQPAISSP